MSLASVQRPSSLPWVLRSFLLAVSVVFCLMLSSGAAGGQASDDHGDTLSTATNLPLGYSIEGRIDPGNDKDVFRLDLSGESGTTDVWIYTTGDLDTVGGLFDSNANRLLVNDDSFIVGRFENFHFRASLRPGIYYVLVISFRDQYIGDYTLHAEAVTDPGSTIDRATRLSLDSPTPGMIGTASNSDYFRLEFTESTNLDLYARSTNRQAIEVVALDSGGSEISINVSPRYVLTSTGLYRHGFWIRDDFGPGTYYVKVFTEPGVDSYPVPYTIHAYEDVRYTDFIDECEAELNDPLIEDSLYACQWHLDNLNETDINVEPVWEEDIKGEGINVAVVDDGMYYTHVDLKDNVDTSKNHDYSGSGDIYTPFEHHGTHVAGLIAARDNDIGVRGVAPRAAVYGYNLLVNPTFLNRADSMGRNKEVTAVSNNSWGHTDGPWLSRAMAFWTAAIESGLTSGYGGKGVFYAYAGGNGHEEGDNSNLDEYNNHYGVTAVCAVNDHDTRSGFSEMGANLWVCAPSDDRSDLHQGILTTENSDRYYEEFDGTSASTPIVSGVAALMRGANPDLTWRDVKLILAGSARRNDARNTGWVEGARRYDAISDSDRYHFNHEYGFGVVDAKAAVDLAKEWRSLPSPVSARVEANRLNLGIPDAPRIGPPATVTSTLRLGTGIEFVEFVEVNVSFRHGSFRDLKVELESPSGAVSQLSVPFDTRTDENPSFAYVALNGTFRFGSARHLGEDPNGVWKLRITDHIPSVRGTLQSWGIKVYGHENPPGAPTVDSVTPGVGDLTVAWRAPEETGSGPITAYDLRYIQTAADETVGSSWTVEEDVWNAETAGSLEYVIPSLVGGVRYDVQVRAVNRAGAGLWSGTVTGTPIQVTTGACGTDGAVADPANNPGLVSDCNSLLAARDALAGSATLNWSANTPIADWQGVTIGGNPQRVTELGLSERELTGAIPTELNRLDNLKRLVLRKNKLTGPIPAWLGDLANLEELSLWGNQLSGPIPTSLGNLVNLKKLLLSRNSLSGPIPAELGDLANLKELRLFDSQLTGTIPTELSRLANLKVLMLAKNQLIGTLPNWLGDLADLEVISLWDNQLTGPIPAEIGNLTNLESLLLRDNRLTGSIPASLSDLDNLQSLSLSQNMLVGCVPEGLRDVASNDFDDLALPFCDVLLESLSISPGTLVQEFDPYRTDYTALASGTRVTLTAASQHNASVMYLDRNDREIADADTSLDGHQVDLRTGITVVRVRVTSQDGLSTNTYTVAVSRAPSAPVIDEVLSGDGYLTVSWTAPDETGGSDIVAYDLRYIQASADQKVESDWAVVENVWTTVDGGDFEHVITGLTGSTQYDVQVRALNRTGAGPWSETATESTEPSECVIRGAVTDATNTGLISDCETLLAVRDELTGTTSTRALNWEDEFSIADWYGVVLSGTPQRVTELRLHGENANVERGLTEAKLNGTIPAELGALRELTLLYLHRNNLTGEVPGGLNSLSNLERLYLYDNHLTGISAELGAGMTSLKRLFAHRNALTGEIPPGLGSMPNLDWLTLYDNDLTGEIPPELGNLTDLRRLYLHRNKLGGAIPGELAYMSSLTHMLLHSNDLRGAIPPKLGDLPNLVWLSLYDNELTGVIPSRLGDLTNLERLYLHRNQLTGIIPSALGSLSSLTNLWLNENELSGTIPDELSNLGSLERWRLAGNDLTGCLPARLAAVANNDMARLGLDICP